MTPRRSQQRVPGHHPARRPGHDGFILEPEESEVVDALGEIRLDDDVPRNHGTRYVSVVGTVVTVRLQLRDGTDSSYIRSAGYRVRAQNVVDGTKCIFRAHEIRKRLVQEVHPDGHVDHGARAAPGTQTRGHAEWSGIELFAFSGHVGFHRFAQLILRARVEIRQCPDCSPTMAAHLLRSDHLREQLLQARLVGLGTMSCNGQFQDRGPHLSDLEVAPTECIGRRRFNASRSMC